MSGPNKAPVVRDRGCLGIKARLAVDMRLRGFLYAARSRLRYIASLRWRLGGVAQLVRARES